MTSSVQAEVSHLLDAREKPLTPLVARMLSDRTIGSGEQLYSASGTQLSPAPKIDTTTARKLDMSRARLNAWLLDEARAEAQATGNDWQQTILTMDTTKALVARLRHKDTPYARPTEIEQLTDEAAVLIEQQAAWIAELEKGVIAWMTNG